MAESVEESVSEESSQESEVVESEALEEVHLYDGVTPLAISGMYDSYGYANAGVIPVCKDEKWGLVNFDNEILVPFEYEDCCALPNDEGQTYFGNPGDYRVFDSEGKELFQTEKTITAVNDGVVLTETDNEAGYHFGYYTLDGAKGSQKGWISYYNICNRKYSQVSFSLFPQRTLMPQASFLFSFCQHAACSAGGFLFGHITRFAYSDGEQTADYEQGLLPECYVLFGRVGACWLSEHR